MACSNLDICLEQDEERTHARPTTYNRLYDFSIWILAGISLWGRITERIRMVLTGMRQRLNERAIVFIHNSRCAARASKQQSITVVDKGYRKSDVDVVLDRVALHLLRTVDPVAVESVEEIANNNRLLVWRYGSTTTDVTRQSFNDLGSTSSLLTCEFLD